MSIDQLVESLLQGDPRALARSISFVENNDSRAAEILKQVYSKGRDVPVIGITGPAGVGKSSLVDQLISVYRAQNLQIGVIAVDPSSPFTGGAILGDRIRMQRHGTDPGVFIRSMATRGKLGGIAAATYDVIDLMNVSGKDILIVETVGVGQDEVDIVKIARTTVVVLMPGLGDEVQAMKAGLMEIADLLVINKADRSDAEKLQAELQTTLSFSTAAPDSWRPPIFKTIATTSAGVDQLAQGIRQHGEYLETTGKIRDKKVQQSRGRMIDALEYQVTSHIIEDGFQNYRIEQKILEIADRKKDPHTAVQELLKQFKLE